VDDTGSFLELPAIYSPAGVVRPVLDYFIDKHSTRSIAWMKKVAEATVLFLEYLAANPNEADPQQVFKLFALRLQTGSISRQTGEDPSGLYWRPCSAEKAANVIYQLTRFFDWVADRRGETNELNPRYAGDPWDRRCDEAAYNFKRKQAFLGHTWNAEAPTGRLVRAARTPKLARTDPPAFPEARFVEFLEQGFRVGRRYSYRDMLITLLLHGAGFRISEPFHLWFEDVTRDPQDNDKALVRIHHPSQGDVPPMLTGPDDHKFRGNRAAYLNWKYGLAPRNEVLGSKSAGWKSGLYDGPTFYHAWWAGKGYAELFIQLWIEYLKQVAQFTDVRPHPFAFVNLNREPVGGMYTITGYCRAHAAACERIGLPVGKKYGTTPHGHRHAYGRRLEDSGLPPRMKGQIIRRAMHHTALESQEVYTEKPMRDLLAALNSGIGVLNADRLATMPARLGRPKVPR
jgi:integrase